MKYTIKNIVGLFFFSFAMRLARFTYKHLSKESQKEIGSIFENGLKMHTSDLGDCPYFHKPYNKQANFCEWCGRNLLNEVK